MLDKKIQYFKNSSSSTCSKVFIFSDKSNNLVNNALRIIKTTVTGPKLSRTQSQNNKTSERTYINNTHQHNILNYRFLYNFVNISRFGISHLLIQFNNIFFTLCYSSNFSKF